MGEVVDTGWKYCSLKSMFSTQDIVGIALCSRACRKVVVSLPPNGKERYLGCSGKRHESTPFDYSA